MPMLQVDLAVSTKGTRRSTAVDGAAAVVLIEAKVQDSRLKSWVRSTRCSGNVADSVMKLEVAADTAKMGIVQKHQQFQLLLLHNVKASKNLSVGLGPTLGLRDKRHTEHERGLDRAFAQDCYCCCQ